MTDAEKLIVADLVLAVAEYRSARAPITYRLGEQEPARAAYEKRREAAGLALDDAMEAAVSLVRPDRKERAATLDELLNVMAESILGASDEAVIEHARMHGIDTVALHDKMRAILAKHGVELSKPDGK